MSNNKYTQLDSDSARLPEDLVRTGYDADESRYYFTSVADGSTWVGPEGAEYGELTQISPGRAGGLTSAERMKIIQQPQVAQGSAYRPLMPFLLIVVLILWALFRYLPGSAGHATLVCAPGLHAVRIAKGDTCWALAQASGVSLDIFKGWNKELDCDALRIGAEVCAKMR